MPGRVVIGLLVAAAAVVLAAVMLGGAGSREAGSPVDPGSVPDPVAAGDVLPPGYRRGLDRDQIEPVYSPGFTSADAVDWPAGSLVIGVAGPETAKAYPVTHLNSHEMVIDSLDDDPILVSW